jgi:hypothetical protein
VATSRRLRIIGSLATGGWLGSWYLMYLEITRWHHVKSSLAFDPGPPEVGRPRPRPGGPLKLLYAACVAAPVIATSALIVESRRVRAAGRQGSRVAGR